MGYARELLEWFRSHPGAARAIVLGSIGVALVYAWVVIVAIARMSPDYFVAEQPPSAAWRGRHPLLRLVLRGLKNLLGLLLFVSGLAMLVLPGQGLLTMFVGLSLVEYPGKRRLEQRIVARPRVIAALNAIRERAGSPPLQCPDLRPLQEA